MTDRKHNRRIWDQVKITDPRMTKDYQAPGGFKGTAVDANWLLERATETLGPVGIGFGWTFPFPPMVVGDLATLVLRFWWVDPDTGARAEYDVVASNDVQIRRKDANFLDSDCFKKALTDAVKLALTKLGFLADIHQGKFDEDGYVQQAKTWIDRQKAAEKAATAPAAPVQVAAPAAVAVAVAAPAVTAAAPAPAPAPVMSVRQRCNALFAKLKALDKEAAKAADAYGEQPDEEARLLKDYASALHKALARKDKAAADALVASHVGPDKKLKDPAAYIAAAEARMNGGAK